MSLARDVQEQLRRFGVGLVSADDLSDWLDEHAQAIHDASDPHMRKLTDLAFSVLEDVFQGQRTTDAARSALDGAVSQAMDTIGSSQGRDPVVTGVRQVVYSGEFAPEGIAEIVETGTAPRDVIIRTAVLGNRSSSHTSVVKAFS